MQQSGALTPINFGRGLILIEINGGRMISVSVIAVRSTEGRAMNSTTHQPLHSRKPLPGAFKVIRLQLAREPKFPEGNPNYGYRLLAPLDHNGRIDPDLWRAHREDCKVVRFKPGEPDEVGHLKRKGKTWAFHYDVQGDDADDTGYHLGEERFVIGEYISVREHDTMHTFKVTSVEHV